MGHHLLRRKGRGCREQITLLRMRQGSGETGGFGWGRRQAGKQRRHVEIAAAARRESG